MKVTREKINDLLKKNRELGVQPQNVNDLAKRIGVTRQAIYEAYKGNAKKVEFKLKQWITSQEKNVWGKIELYIYENMLDLLETKYHFIKHVGYYESEKFKKGNVEYSYFVDDSSLKLCVYVSNDWRYPNIYAKCKTSYEKENDFEEEWLSEKNVYEYAMVDECLGIDGIIYDLIVDGIVYKAKP